MTGRVELAGVAVVDVLQGEYDLTDERRVSAAVSLRAPDVHNSEPGVESAEFVPVLRNQILFDFSLVFRTVERLPLCFRERATCTHADSLRSRL